MDLIRTACASRRTRGDVIDRHDSDETSGLVHDGKPPDLLLGHSDQGCSYLIVSPANEGVWTHHLTDPDVPGKAVRSCQSYTNIAIRDHSSGLSLAIENGKRSAIVVPHGARGLDDRIARSAGSGRRRHDILYLHRKTPPQRDHRVLPRSVTY
jgi:hypothetical protein